VYNIKQFKVSSGEELICEVIEWPEEGCDEIIVKNIMEIMEHYDKRDNNFYYMFKPWIHYQENNLDVILLSSKHVIATSNPNYMLEQQYAQSVTDMHIVAVEKRKEYEENQMKKLQELTDALNALSSDKSKKTEPDDKKLTSNIIKFPNEDTLH
jgi:hypothetical protein